MSKEVGGKFRTKKRWKMATFESFKYVKVRGLNTMWQRIEV